MGERAYTVSELDRLRRAVETKWLYGSFRLDDSRGWHRSSRMYRNGEREQAVEAIVRTHMLAGHTAEDLYASEDPALSPSSDQR